MHQNSRYRPAIVLAATLFMSACSAPDAAPQATGAPTALDQQRETPSPAAQDEQNPTPNAAVSPTILTYRTTDGMFEFDYPSDWSIVPVPAPGQATWSLTVQDARGRTMANLAAGFPAASDSVVVGPIEPVPLEYLKIPEGQLETTFEGTAIAFHYETRFNPGIGEVGAGMSIDTFKTSFPISSSLPGFNVDSATGAAFTRWIGASDDLPDIDPEVKAAGGTALYEAYQRTAEYQAVKEMMISLRRLA